MTRPISSIVAALALMGGVCVGAPAQAQEALIKGLMSGLGFSSSDDPVIDYHERPALVVPKNKQALPPPQQRASNRRADWPVDPNMVERQAQAANDRSMDSGRRPLTPDQLRYGARAGTGSVGTGSTSLGASKNGVVPWEELGGTFLAGKMMSGIRNGNKEETLPFTGEKPRSTLTEPPPGYRTPSKNAPYGPRGIRPYDPDSAQARASKGQ